MTEWRYRARNGLFDGERRYRLTRDALCWAESGKTDGRLAYADTRAMQLVGYGPPDSPNLQCKLTAKTGGKVLLRSAHYADLGEFEDRSETFGPFVRELAKRIAAANPNAAFIAGSTGIWVIWIFVGLIWAAVLGAFALAFFDSSLLGALAGVLGLGAVCLPIVWHEIGRGGRRRFDPLNPPQALVGPAISETRKDVSS